MIFDWFENSRKILDTKKLSADDDWERRRIFAQEMALCQYLIQEGKEKAEIFNIWKTLQGGIWDLLSGDEIGRQLYFEKVYAQAKRAGPLAILPEVELTEQEISYLNSLQAPYEIRKYWIRLLVYVKTKKAMRQTPKIDKFVEIYLIRSAGIIGRIDNIPHKIRKWSLRCGIPFPVKVVPYNSGVISAYFPEWIGGFPVKKVRMGEFDNIDALLEEKTFVCRRCGRKYDANAHRKKDLCPPCAEHVLREYKTEFERKRRLRIKGVKNNEGKN